MKALKPLYAFLFLFIVVTAFMACNDTDDGKFVKPITLYEKVNGDWLLTNLSLIDETANALGISPKEISLFDQFDFVTFGLALNVDDDDQPTTYQVTGTAPELFPASGYWALNSPFPTTTGTFPLVNLYSDAAKTVLTGQLSITTTPGSVAEMDLKMTRFTGGVAYASYQYKLIKNQ